MIYTQIGCYLLGYSGNIVQNDSKSITFSTRYVKCTKIILNKIIRLQIRQVFSITFFVNQNASCNYTRQFFARCVHFKGFFPLH